MIIWQYEKSKASIARRKMMRIRKLKREMFNDWIFDQIGDYRARLEVYCGGAGSGKSHGAMQKVLLKAMNGRRRVLVVRKVGRTLKDSVFALVKSLLAESAPRGAYTINKTDMEIELINGSVFLFRGMDDSEKIKSIDGLTDIVCEEATELTADDFTQLNLRLRPDAEFPQIYLMFNPVSKLNWVYGYFFENRPENARITLTSYKDNKFLSNEYIGELEGLKARNPAYYRIYALGEFATLDALVFPVWEKMLIGAEETEGLPFFAGLDFGYTNDPTALVWGRYDRERRRIYVCGEYYRRGLLNPELAEIIKSIGLSKEIITADSARRDSIDELKRLHGIQRIEASKKGPDSVLHGIQFLHQHELIVDERLSGLCSELENYTWVRDKRTGEYRNEPIDSYNHGVDALRYAMERFQTDRTATVVPKARWGGVF